jgi:thioredoxin 1
MVGHMSLYQVTEKNITEILEKNPIVVLDFWASWCQPCKSMLKIFENVSDKNTDIFFGTVDSEAELVLSSDFQIQAVPTIVILKDSTIIWERSGAMPEYLLQDMVTKAKTIDVNTL